MEGAVDYIKRFVKEYRWALLVIVILYLVKLFIVSPYQIQGESMSPTFHDGNYILVNKLNTTPVKGDIIIFDNGSGKKYIKRVIATSGDSFEYVKDKLYINGRLVEEDYLDRNLAKRRRAMRDISLNSLLNVNEVPEGTVFVMGDNRLNSIDSRLLGFIDLDRVDGTYLVKIY